jgi:hypothetical protein
VAVTIEKRPIGVVLNPTGVSANINADYSSIYATVNSTNHGLSDGQYVYIKSNVENYNGFWVIDVINTNEFALRDDPYVAWIVDADVTYYTQVTTHGWSCVHLPIAYELSNTRFPINTVDTARTISSISNDLGYVNLNLSGSLGTFNELAFVKVSNAPTSSLNGVYQVVDKISTSDVTINLAYSAATNAGMSGASVQLYYSNYCILVRIYAGINASHEWADQKPYELAATLQFIPDDSNDVKFSVHEILKSYVRTKNNLTLATLPNNIDAWTNFRIEVAEQYDTSNGYTITTLTSGYAADSFEGTAVNAMLAFKNVHSGYLSDYIMVNSTSKFLTLFAIPVLFACSDDLPDCYNEVSFIKTDGTELTMSLQYYSAGVAGTLSTIVIDDDEGLIRTPVTASCSFDRVDISLRPTGDQQTEAAAIGVLTANGIPSGSSAYSLIPVNTILSNYSESISIPWILNSLSGAVLATSIEAQAFDSDGVAIGFSFSQSMGTSAPASGTLSTSSLDVNAAFIGIRINATFPVSGSATATVEAGTITLSPIGVQDDISETKQFTIDCGCSDQKIRISWLNNLAAFESPWAFTAQTEHAIDIGDTGETRQDIFPTWGQSYGEFADTIQKNTYRDSNERKFVFSQFLTQDQADAISYIKSSPLVQIVNSRTDRRTIIVDTDSFTKYKDGDKTYTVQFNFRYTNDLPSQGT